METIPTTILGDKELECLALMLNADIIKASPGKVVLQSAEAGAAPANLACFERHGNAWLIKSLEEESRKALDVLKNEEQPVWQWFVNDIHDRFWQDQSLGELEVYEKALEAGVSQTRLDCFVLAKLNYQVCNGGFSQWVENGYSSLLSRTKEALKRVGTKKASMVFGFLSELEEVLDPDGMFQEAENDIYECEYCGGSGVIYEDDEEEREGCPECDGLGEIEDMGECPGVLCADRLNDQYYEIDDSFCEEIECYAKGEDRNTAGFGLPVWDKKAGDPLFPNITVQLSGEDGNAFSVINKVSKALRQAGAQQELIMTYFNEAIKGDYSDLINTTMKWVVVK